MLKRKTFFIYCSVVLIIITFAVLIAGVGEADTESADTGVSDDVSDYNTEPEMNTETTYFVTAGDGVLCVYNCTGNSQVLTDAITYIDLYSLDSNMRKSLDSGMVFENRMEVIRFIENISS